MKIRVVSRFQGLGDVNWTIPDGSHVLSYELARDKNNIIVGHTIYYTVAVYETTYEPSL